LSFTHSCLTSFWQNWIILCYYFCLTCGGKKEEKEKSSFFLQLNPTNSSHFEPKDQKRLWERRNPFSSQFHHHFIRSFCAIIFTLLFLAYGLEQGFTTQISWRAKNNIFTYLKLICFNKLKGCFYQRKQPNKHKLGFCRPSAGHIWPAGRLLCMPSLDSIGYNF